MPAPTSWAARAFLRSVEESAYDEADLREGRALARSGRLGSVMVIAGMASVAGPATAGERTLAQVKVEPLADWGALVAEVARRAGFLAALEAGSLPDELVENAAEAGVDLVPDAGGLETGCTCQAWVQPCRHALALLTQLGWHLDTDPYVLLLLRGRTREWLVAEVDAVTRAAAYARRLLDLAHREE
ncbi:hypothetical protein D9V37_18300 [Nocardioides mangrovicus]|uniref:SWIM-type domain-containing protein n=1 Tax=Nocardioides mangrovicus TaxID=2478913 RepID=A0A3L8NY05_9ACTN|nr:hypothetical protein D9V37_18300 [Nocardioides mangrovicus]